MCDVYTVWTKHIHTHTKKLYEKECENQVRDPSKRDNFPAKCMKIWYSTVSNLIWHKPV